MKKLEKSFDPEPSLIFLRHGRTSLNLNEVLQGSQSDVDLDEVGSRQSHNIGEYIRKKYTPDLVLASSAKRTQQTLEAAGFSDFEIREDFNEMNYGNLEGQSIKKYAMSMLEEWQKDPTCKNFSEDYSKNGESLQELYDRVSAGCEELISQDKYKCILICSHATPIKAAVAYSVGLGACGILKLHINLSSVSIINKISFGKSSAEESGLVLSKFNETLIT